MSKIKKILSREIIKAIINLPYFNLDDLVGLTNDRHYLKISLSRLSKRGAIINLKRGVYTSKNHLDFLERKNGLADYLEFLGCAMYSPAYLSLEYVLAENNILTENVQSITLITNNKTKRFANYLSKFNYHHIRPELYTGFEIIKKNGLIIYKASLAKALFDFLYLRKNIIINETVASELRLNLEILKKNNINELKKYIKLEKSKKMRKIFNWLF